MYQYVARMDFILGPQASAPYNCGLISYGDTAYLNFIRNIEEPKLERKFWEALRELNVEATVETNPAPDSYNDNRKSKFENFDCKSLIC